MTRVQRFTEKEERRGYSFYLELWATGRRGWSIELNIEGRVGRGGVCWRDCIARKGCGDGLENATDP
jgi:hypothetical protein